MVMMAITTSNSIKVKFRRLFETMRFFISSVPFCFTHSGKLRHHSASVIYFTR